MFRETETVVSPPLESAAKPRRAWRAFRFVVVSLSLALLGSAVGAFAYFWSLKTTPQYSLALLVDASRRGDAMEIASLVDSDAVVDNFIPQIVSEATELYGRGLPPQVIADLSKLIKPFLPAIKARARNELPEVIRNKTSSFERFPFWIIVIGADRMLNIRIEGDRAFVSSSRPENSFECEMRRAGERWIIVGIKDKELARSVAGKVGEQIGAAVADDRINSIGEKFGIKNLEDVLEKIEAIVR